MEPRSMLEKLILYFVYQTKGHVTRTQLVKYSTAPMLAVKDKHERSEKVRLNLALERELLLEELGV